MCKMTDYIVQVILDQKKQTELCWIKSQLNAYRYPLSPGEYVYVVKDREGQLAAIDRVALWSVSGLNADGMELVETPDKTSDDVLHEVFIGSFVTNACQTDVLNFTYVYGGKTSRSSRSSQTIVYEKVDGEMPFDDAIRVLTPEELFVAFTQLLFATIYGVERFGWSHGNLVGNNVSFRCLGEDAVWLKYNILGQLLYVRCGCVVSMKDFSQSHVVYDDKDIGIRENPMADLYTFLASVTDALLTYSVTELSEMTLFLVDAWKNARDLRELLENLSKHPLFWENVSVYNPHAVLSSFRPSPEYNGYESLVDVYDRDKTRREVRRYDDLRDSFMDTFHDVHNRIAELKTSLLNREAWTALTPENIVIYPEDAFYTPQTMITVRGYFDKVMELRWLHKRYAYYILIGKDVFTSHKDTTNYDMIQTASNEYNTDIRRQVDDITTHYSLAIAAIRKRIRSVRGTYYLQNEPILRGYFDMECF